MRVNLFDRKKSRPEIRWGRIVITVLIIIFIALPAIHFYLNYTEVRSLRDQSERLSNQLESLRAQEEEYFELREKISEFEMPEEIEITRYRLREPMREFGNIMPEELSLERMDYSDGEMELAGFASEIEMILQLAENIHGSELLELESLNHFQREDYIDFNMSLYFDTREELPK